MPNNDFDSLFDETGQKYNIDPSLLKTIFHVESNGRVNPQTSSAGAVGPMQLMPDTAAYLGVSDPTDMRQAVDGAARYVAEGLEKTGSPEGALAYYFAGPDKANWGPKTASYVQKAQSLYPQMKILQTAAPTQSPDFMSRWAIPASEPLSQTQTSAPSADFASRWGLNQAPQVAATSAATAPLTAAVAPEAAVVAPTPAASDPMAGVSEYGISDPADSRVAASQTPAGAAIAAGLGRAVRDITDVPAAALAKGAEATGLTGLMKKAGIPAPTGAETAAGNTADLQSYNQEYGSDPTATAARIGGQVAATLPILSTGAGMLGGAADAVGSAIGRAAPWLGSAVQGATDFLAGSAGGNALTRGASLATSGALQGGTAGALTAGQSEEPIGQQALSGAKIGAIAAPMASSLGYLARTATGGSGGASPEIAQLADLARNTYGIPVTVPQMSNNSLVRITNDQSSRLPFSGAGGQAAAQQEAWQRAVSTTFGENAPQITPDVMSSAARRIGGVFNDVAKRTNVTFDGPILTDLGRIEQESASAPLGSGGTNAIHSQIDNIIDAAATGNGTISGQAYQQLIRAGSPLQRAQQAGDPNVRYYANQVREALDGAFQRSAAPEDQAALTQARLQYRNMKTIEDLVEKSPDGNLSPALLMGQVRSASSRFDPSTGGMAYTGGGPLGDLARIGQAFLKPPPNSGTPDRMMINTLLGGGAAAAAYANPLNLVGIPIGLGANRMIGGYLRSGPYAQRVIDSSLNTNANSLSHRLLPSVAPIGAIGANSLSRQQP